MESRRELLKILYIASSFPNTKNGDTIYTDLAEALHEAGHEITVAVSEQSKVKKLTQMRKERGFDVLRIVIGNYYDVSLLEKGITTLKLPLLMKKNIKRYLGNREFDFILFESPPVTIAGVIAWAKQYFNCPSYLMLKDIFPQNAIDLEIIKEKSMLHQYFLAQEKKLLQVADYIGCMSKANKQYLLEHVPWINPNKLEIFPNTKKITPSKNIEGFPMRNRYKIPENACVFLFGGNMGRPQCIDLLCEVIKRCKDDENIFFLFIGRGTDRYKLEQTIQYEHIKNALVIENLPRNEYEQITQECDVGLIVLDPRFSIPNYPSRILSYMEYAKPVIAAIDKATDFKKLIEIANCGAYVWSADIESFISVVKEMSKSEKLSHLGANGRQYLEENFSVEKSVEILEGHFKKVGLVHV